MIHNIYLSGLGLRRSASTLHAGDRDNQTARACCLPSLPKLVRSRSSSVHMLRIEENDSISRRPRPPMSTMMSVLHVIPRRPIGARIRMEIRHPQAYRQDAPMAGFFPARRSDATHRRTDCRLVRINSVGLTALLGASHSTSSRLGNPSADGLQVGHSARLGSVRVNSIRPDRGSGGESQHIL
jgi:hypothetical protein